MDDLPNKQQAPDDNSPITKTGGHPEKEPGRDVHLEEVEKAPELASEIQEAGVEHVKEEIELSSEDKAAGIEEAAEVTPVSEDKFPLTDEQIKKALHQKLSDSILWLATWCVRQLKLAHHKVRR